MRSLGLILALLSALGVGSLRPWLLSHCTDAAVATCADACCPTEPSPAVPAPETCTFCAAVVVAPDDLIPGDVVVMPSVQPTPVLLQLSRHAHTAGHVPASAPPPGGIRRHLILLI